MSDTQRPCCALELLDVLEQLPRDVLRTNLWLLLVSKDATTHSSGLAFHLGRAFRLSCRRARTLADQLTRRLHLLLAPEDTQVQGTFLALQEGLEALSLEFCTVDEAAGGELVASTLRLGGAPCQRLGFLKLEDGSTRSHTTCAGAAGRAVHLHCPNLRTLIVDAAHVDASFFEPFCTSSILSQVVVGTGAEEYNEDCGPLLQALARLPGLQRLTLVGTLRPVTLSLLTAFTGLLHLELEESRAHVTLADGAAVGRLLGTLTQLTRLALPHWVTDSPCDVINAVVAQLGNLQSLSSLTVGHDDRHLVALGAASFGALCHLSGLTRLSGPSATLDVLPTPGHLPALEHLDISGSLSGRELAATLRPLRPLTQLRQATLSVYLDDEPMVAVSEDSDAAGGGDGAEIYERGTARRTADHSAAAAQAASLLAGAPHLQRLYLSLQSCDRHGRQIVGVANALLAPLLARLTALCLDGMSAGTLSAVLPLVCQASGLEELSLCTCHVSRKGLLQVVKQLGRLRLLAVRRCPGVSGASAVALGAARVQPLRIVWAPELEAEHLRRFREVASEGVVLENSLP